MWSKKRPNNKTQLSRDGVGEGDLKRNSKNYIGKLRPPYPNFDRHGVPGL